MADFGSCFEDFDPHPPGNKDMASHSHAWSAHPLYLLMQIIGGVRIATPGWESVSVNPIDPGCHGFFKTENQSKTVRFRWDRWDED